MVYLVIDQGNSSCKWAFIEMPDKGPVSSWLVEPMEIVHTESGVFLSDDYWNKYHPKACIYSNVGKDDAAFEQELRRRVPHYCRYTIHTPIPIKNAYRTPETLGLDRLAAAVGAWSLAPGRNSLIVDMGTANTYDLLTADACYQGGNIAPGMFLRLKALHNYTASLPMVEESADFMELGVDTETAIQSGVMQGILYELEGYIRRYASEYTDLLVFLTGGDMIYLSNKLKSGIFANPNLVLIGLNRILYDYVHQ